MNMNVRSTLNNKKTADLVRYFFVLGYIALFAFHLTETEFKDFTWIVMILALYVIRHTKFVLHSTKFNLLFWVLPVIELYGLLTVLSGNASELVLVIFLFMVADVVYHYVSFYSVIVMYAGFLIYFFNWPIYDRTIGSLAIRIVNYSILTVPLLGSKLFLNQRDYSRELNNALLREADTMKEMAVLKERNKIAEEVHDTVGHRLTTAIVALEGANLLIKKDPNEAHNKILIAKEQLKNGLGDIRSVVRALRSDIDSLETLDYESAIKKMIEAIELQTQIRFDFVNGFDRELLVLQEHVVVSTIKESITNSIKHGKSKNIIIKLLSQQDLLVISIEDDGIGAEHISKGFGLNTMENRVMALGGQLKLSSDREGFRVEVLLPIAKEYENEE